MLFNALVDYHVYMEKFLLLSHIVLGVFSLVGAIAPLFKWDGFDELFKPSIIGVTISGAALLVSGGLLPKACVRFLSVLVALIAIRVMVLHAADKRTQ